MPTSTQPMIGPPNVLNPQGVTLTGSIDAKPKTSPPKPQQQPAQQQATQAPPNLPGGHVAGTTAPERQVQPGMPAPALPRPVIQPRRKVQTSNFFSGKGHLGQMGPTKPNSHRKLAGQAGLTWPPAPSSAPRADSGDAINSLKEAFGGEQQPAAVSMYGGIGPDMPPVPPALRLKPQGFTANPGIGISLGASGARDLVLPSLPAGLVGGTPSDMKQKLGVSQVPDPDVDSSIPDQEDVNNPVLTSVDSPSPGAETNISEHGNTNEVSAGKPVTQPPGTEEGAKLANHPPATPALPAISGRNTYLGGMWSEPAQRLGSCNDELPSPIPRSLQNWLKSSKTIIHVDPPPRDEEGKPMVVPVDPLKPTPAQVLGPLQQEETQLAQHPQAAIPGNQTGQPQTGPLGGPHRSPGQTAAAQLPGSLVREDPINTFGMAGLGTGGKLASSDVKAIKAAAALSGVLSPAIRQYSQYAEILMLEATGIDRDQAIERCHPDWPLAKQAATLDAMDSELAALDGEQERRRLFRQRQAMKRLGRDKQADAASMLALAALGGAGGSTLGSLLAPKGSKGEGAARGAHFGLTDLAGGLGGAIAGNSLAHWLQPSDTLLHAVLTGGGALGGGMLTHQLERKLLGPASWHRKPEHKPEKEHEHEHGHEHQACAAA